MATILFMLSVTFCCLTAAVANHGKHSRPADSLGLHDHELAETSLRSWRNDGEWRKHARLMNEGVIEKVKTGSAAQRLQFSWQTVPVYQQLCNPNATLTQAFPEERLKFLATHYPIITLEHCQGYYTFTQGSSNDTIEDYFLAAARQLKAMNSNITVLFYSNSIAGLTYYRWCSEGFKEHPSWRLTNEKGKLCQSGGGHMLPHYSGFDWDQRQGTVREWWASLCRDLANKTDSPLSGCSIDTAGSCLDDKEQRKALEEGRRQAVTLAQQMTGSDYIVGAVGAAPEDKVQLSQIYTFGPNKESLDWLNQTRQAGMIAEAHAQSAVGVAGDHVNASLAAFLIGAYEKSYFAFSTNPGAGYHPFCDGTAPTWCYGMGWIEEFAKPLGPPLGDAVVSGGGMHFERRFQSGTNVTLDLQEKSCEIHWADGTSTICKNF